MIYSFSRIDTCNLILIVVTPGGYALRWNRWGIECRHPQPTMSRPLGTP